MPNLKAFTSWNTEIRLSLFLEKEYFFTWNAKVIKETHILLDLKQFDLKREKKVV